MINKLIIRKILVICVVSFLTISIFLAKKSYKLVNKNNNLQTLSLKSNNSNFYTNYTKEIKNIYEQINILDNAIIINNLTIKNRDMMLNYNINYSKSKKNNIRRKINFANLTIKNELNVLYEIKNIVVKHPYNYLTIFKQKNYSFPDIYLEKKGKNYNLLDNFKTHISKINICNANFNNISYQSEESLIGVKNITSFISSSKSNVLSKINLNNSNIFYYSKYLSILTTSNKFIHIHSSYGYKNPISKEKFINKGIENTKTKCVDSKSSLSNITGVGNYIVHKPYIIASPIFVTTGIIISILVGQGWYRERYLKKLDDSILKNPRLEGKADRALKKLEKSSNRFQNNSKRKNRQIKDAPESMELLPMNTGINSIQIESSHQELLSNSHLHNDSSPADIQSKPTELFEKIPTQNTIIPELPNVGVEVSIHSEKNDTISHNDFQHIDTSIWKLVSSDGNILLLKDTDDSASTLAKSGGFKFNPLLKKSQGKLSKMYELLEREKVEKHLNHEPDPSTSRFISKDEITTLDLILSNREKINFRFYSDMNSVIKDIKISSISSKAQILNFIYQRKIYSLECSKNPSQHQILTNIMKIINNRREEQDKEYELFRQVFGQITTMGRNKVVLPNTYTTTNGWFRKPMSLRRLIHRFPVITTEQHEFIKSQKKQIDDLHSWLPEHYNTYEYLKKIETNLKKTPSVAEHSELNNFISSGIISDFNEIIEMYQDYLNTPREVNDEIFNGPNYKTFPDCMKRLIDTPLVRKDITGISDVGVTEDEVYSASLKLLTRLNILI